MKRISRFYLNLGFRQNHGCPVYSAFCDWPRLALAGWSFKVRRCFGMLRVPWTRPGRFWPLEGINYQLMLVVSPIIYRVSYIPGGARFQPSTVSQKITSHQPPHLHIKSMDLEVKKHILRPEDIHNWLFLEALQQMQKTHMFGVCFHRT